MKNVFFLFLIFLAFNSTAQNISGLYSGTLYNDTTKQTQAYELALSEYRGKIFGYAYATFIASDTFYYSIRRVKATKRDGELVVEDGEMLANNFPQRPDKGVKRITQIPLESLQEGDTLSHFNATWKTTRTKEFFSLPGTMTMKRDNDSSQSALMGHLLELKVLPDPQAAVAPKVKAAAASTNATPTKENKEMAAAPLPYNQRQQKLLQTINIISDSITLSFYDNGVVDGDVISVYVNGQSVVSNSKLLAVATKKVVQLNTLSDDEVELVLVAETLGSIPPNTGLLVVYDGTQKHEIRFSADLQTNATVIFKKTK